MKKKTIWIIAVIMGLSFVILLGLQLTYIQEMANMKKEQFDESVNRALYQASRNLELNETLRYLEKDVNETERHAYRVDSVGTRSGNPDDGTVQRSHQFAVQGICDAIKDMPHCIFDVMRGRCIFSITHDTMEENGELWRYGIKSSRLTEKINEISANIREERDYGYQ